MFSRNRLLQWEPIQTLEPIGTGSSNLGTLESEPIQTWEAIRTGSRNPVPSPNRPGSPRTHRNYIVQTPHSIPLWKISVGGIPNSKEVCMCKVNKLITTLFLLKHCGKVQQYVCKVQQVHVQRPNVHFASTKVHVQNPKVYLQSTKL